MHARLLFLFALLFAVPVRAASGPASAFQVGINLDAVNDYAAESPFVDAFKQSRHWGTAASPWDEAATIDTNGWPTQDAGVVILCCITNSAGGSLLTGLYTLSFTGQATLGLTVGGTGTILDQSYDVTKNLTVSHVKIAATASLVAVSFTNTKRLPTDSPGTGVTAVHSSGRARHRTAARGRIVPARCSPIRS